MKKLFLFDFDGVLADTLGDMLEFATQACVLLACPCTPTPADLEALETMDMYAYGRQLGVPEADIQQFVVTLQAKFRDNPEPTRIFPGIQEVVTSLGESDIKAIITGNAEGVVVNYLQHHGLEGHFQLIYSGEMPGTRTHKILKAIRDAGVRGQDCYLISDAVSDIRAAQEIGTRSIAVTWGYQSRRKLESAHPNAVADSPAELSALLAAIDP